MATTNHSWLITGSASGIGAATVAAAAAAGDEILALDIDARRGAQLAEASGAVFQQCDVSDPEHWQQAAASFADRRSPDRIHLNAGIKSRLKSRSRHC